MLVVRMTKREGQALGGWYVLWLCLRWEVVLSGKTGDPTQPEIDTECRVGRCLVLLRLQGRGQPCELRTRLGSVYYLAEQYLFGMERIDVLSDRLDLAFLDSEHHTVVVLVVTSACASAADNPLYRYLIPLGNGVTHLPR